MVSRVVLEFRSFFSSFFQDKSLKKSLNLEKKRLFLGEKLEDYVSLCYFSHKTYTFLLSLQRNNLKMFTQKYLTSHLFLAATTLSVALLTPTTAMALTFRWSFVTDAFSTGGAGNTVSGIISGLREGENFGGPFVSVTVDSVPQLRRTPTDQLLGGGWNCSNPFIDEAAFVVTQNQITFANAQCHRENGDQLDFKLGGDLFPQLATADLFPNFQNQEGQNTFTSTPVPEPENLLGLMVVGISLLSSLRQKQNK